MIGEVSVSCDIACNPHCDCLVYSELDAISASVSYTELLVCEVSNASQYWDDLSGKALEPKGVEAARREDMAELAKHNVYTKVPISECWKATGKEPIGTRWIDVNKGDDDEPDYRSHLVAQELNVKKREDLFAATPLSNRRRCFSRWLRQPLHAPQERGGGRGKVPGSTSHCYSASH